jgi:hypothetical protein
MRDTLNVRSLSDDELLRRLSEILKDSRRLEADLVVLGPDRVDSSDTAPSAGVLSEDKRDAGGESCRPGTLHKAVGSSHPITRPARGVLRVTPGRGAKRNAP